MGNERIEPLHRAGPSKKVTLVGVAAVLPQKIALRLGFYPFSDDRQPQALAQRHDGFGNDGVVGVGQRVAHKRLVNLELVQREALEVGQGRVAGAKVIQ